MGLQYLLDLAGRQPVGGDVDDVVGTRHHVDVAVRIEEPVIGGLVIFGEFAEIRLDKAVNGLPQGRQRPGRQQQFDRDGADLAGRELAGLARRIGVEDATSHPRTGRVDEPCLTGSERGRMPKQRSFLRGSNYNCVRPHRG
jgi:hypothetical protein